MANIIISCGCPMNTVGQIFHTCIPQHFYASNTTRHFHSFRLVHHVGDFGVHFCPTGLKECEGCDEVVEDDSDACVRWGS